MYNETIIKQITQFRTVKGADHMKDISTIRRTVATIANQLHKLGYTLSKAFKTAWTRVKEGMTVKAQGVTFGNRQGLLQFIAGRKPEELTTYLRRDRANTFDKYAVAVVVGIEGIGYAHISYLPKSISQSMAVVLDNGMELQADVKVIGGYNYKETYGALVNIAI